jgi:hypothetical protein
MDTSNNRVLTDDLGESGRLIHVKMQKALGLRRFRRVAVVSISRLFVHATGRGQMGGAVHPLSQAKRVKL